MANACVETLSISVLIADEQVLLAESLALALGYRAGFDVFDIAESSRDALAAVERRRPDVVLVGERLDGTPGTDVARQLLAADPDLAVLVLASDSRPPSVRAAVEAGCMGLLRRDEQLDEVVSAVNSVAAGMPRYPGEMLTAVVEVVRSPRRQAIASITPRELEVLRLLARGYSTDQIAAELVVSRHTVRGYTQRLLTKLGAHSKLEAVVVGLRRRIITIEDLDEPET